METINSKEAKKAERAAKRASRREKFANYMSDHANDAALDGWILSGRTLKSGFTKNYDVAGAVAEFQHGANIGSRVTLTRVALVGIFALGLKKDRNKIYVLLEFPDGKQELIETKAKNEKAARKFASSVNAASRYFADKDSA